MAKKEDGRKGAHNWVNKLKNRNAELEKENADLKRQAKKVGKGQGEVKSDSEEVKKLQKRVKTLQTKLKKSKRGKSAQPEGDTVEVPLIEYYNMEHEVENLSAANEEYEQSIQLYADENDNLRQELDILTEKHSKEKKQWRITKKRLVWCIDTLNQLLRKLPKAVKGKFKESEDFERFLRIYKRDVVTKKR